MIRYLLSVVSAAIISSVVVSLFDGNSTYRSIVKLLSGLFLSITVLTPLAKMDISLPMFYGTDIETECGDIIAEGKAAYEKERRAVISSEIESYITDKATALGAQLEVQVSLSDDEPPVPVGVVLDGEASPYARNSLEKVLDQELNIPKERQIWK